VGHFLNQCPNDKQVKIVDDSANEDLLVCCADNSVDSWVMDSGVSFHATHNTEALHNLVIWDFGNVRLADNILLMLWAWVTMLKTSVGFWT